MPCAWTALRPPLLYACSQLLLCRPTALARPAGPSLLRDRGGQSCQENVGSVRLLFCLFLQHVCTSLSHTLGAVRICLYLELSLCLFVSFALLLWVCLDLPVICLSVCLLGSEFQSQPCLKAWPEQDCPWQYIFMSLPSVHRPRFDPTRPSDPPELNCKVCRNNSCILPQPGPGESEAAHQSVSYSHIPLEEDSSTQIPASLWAGLAEI